MKTDTIKTPTKPAAKPAPAAKAKPSGIATLDILAGITKPAAKSAAKVYPTIPDPDKSLAAIADQLAGEIDEYKALEASVSTLKAEIIALGRQHFYTANHGKADPASSVEARGAKHIILCTFQNRYMGSANAEAVTAIIGEDAERYFRQSFSLKIDGDLLPADDANEIISKLAAVLAEHGCSEALSAKAAITPTKEYHTARHKYDPEVNLELDRLCPPVGVIRVKS